MPRPPSPPSPTLLALFRRRWALPILGVLHNGEQLSGWAGGAKFVTLCRHLEKGGASQTSVRESLDHLIELGFVAGNTGYGHPLRPEYVLTRRGDRLAPTCAAIDQTLIALKARDLGLRRWSLPVVHAIDRLEPARFNAVADHLSDITDRALSLAIKGLCAGELIDRRTGTDDSTPATSYLLAPAGAPLAQLLARL